MSFTSTFLPENAASNPSVGCLLGVTGPCPRTVVPDQKAFVKVAKGPTEKTWIYFPHSRDPETRTTITLRAGVVANFERKLFR